MKNIFLTIGFIAVFVPCVSAKQYPNEVREAIAKEPRIRQGWNIELSGGAGIGEFNFQQIGQKTDMQHVSNSLAYPTWDAAFGLNYYFVDWFGLGTGVQFSSYSNVSKVVTPWTYHHVDPSGEGYTFTAAPNQLSETQNMAFLEVPLALKFRAIPNKVGFVGTLGMKFAFPMYNSYKLAEGGYITNKVNYDSGNITPLANTTIAPVDGKLTPSALNKLNYVGYAELGILIRLHQRVDMNVSVYGNYYINNVMTDAPRASLGSADSYGESQYPIPFKTSYAGVLTTNEVKELHPWSAGLRVGFQFNLSRTKAQRDYDKQQRKLKKGKLQPTESLMDHVVNIERKLDSLNTQVVIVKDTLYLPSSSNQESLVETDSVKVVVAGDSINDTIPLTMPILTTIEVVRGNRLAQLARRYYKQTDYWPYIYEANKDKLVSPHLIHIGMKLDIPDVSQCAGTINKQKE